MAEEQHKKYVHFFDYFNEEFKWIAGAEPESDSTEMPKIEHRGYYETISYIVYTGWCEYAPNHNQPWCGSPYWVYCTRDKDTKELKLIYEEEVLPPAGIPQGVSEELVRNNPEFSKMFLEPRVKRHYHFDEARGSIGTRCDYAKLCEFIGAKLPESYNEYVQALDNEARAAYEQTRDFETFKKWYFKVKKPMVAACGEKRSWRWEAENGYWWDKTYNKRKNQDVSD